MVKSSGASLRADPGATTAQVLHAEESRRSVTALAPIGRRLALPLKTRGNEDEDKNGNYE